MLLGGDQLKTRKLIPANFYTVTVNQARVLHVRALHVLVATLSQVAIPNVFKRQDMSNVAYSLIFKDFVLFLILFVLNNS